MNSSRPRFLNRSQTGPEGPEEEVVIPSRSLSASSRIRSTPSNSSITSKFITVEPRRPRHSSAEHRAFSSLSLDDSRSSECKSSPQELAGQSFIKTVLGPVPSNDFGDEMKSVTALPFLDLAASQAVKSHKYLCKKKIKYIVNLSGISINPALLSSERDCACSVDSIEPEELSVLLDDQSSTMEILLQFRRVNEKIDEARRHKDHRVLLCSDDICLSQTFVIQYIMSYYNVSLKRASCQYEHNTGEVVSISPTFRAALESWEEKVSHKGTLEQMSSLSSSQSSSSSPTIQPRRWLSRRKSLLSVGRSASRESVSGNGSVITPSSNRITNIFRPTQSQSAVEPSVSLDSPNLDDRDRKSNNKKIAWA